MLRSLNPPEEVYNDLADLPYDYHLDRIGHEINFDTLIVTRAENKYFHDLQKVNPEFETFDTNIYYADRRTHLLTDHILCREADSIHRKYVDKRIISLSDYLSGALYSSRFYKYKANGELDSLIVKEKHSFTATKSDSTHFKLYGRPDKIKVYKENGRLVKVVDEKRDKYHILNYHGDFLYQIITFDSKTKEKENVTTFNRQGLVTSIVNEIQQTENQYSFDFKGRWTKRTQFVNGRLFEVTTRKYID